MRISDWSSDVCSSDLETEADQPALAGENLHRQLTAIFASHRPLHALDDRRAQAAIILELLGAVLNGDPRFPADELVVGALICVLKPAPAAHVLEQDRLEFGPTA